MLSIKHTHSLAHTCIVCKHNGVSLSFRRKYAILSISATPSYDSDRYVWANLKKINRTSATQRQQEGTRKERQISKFCTHLIRRRKKIPHFRFWNHVRHHSWVFCISWKLYASMLEKAYSAKHTHTMFWAINVKWWRWSV